MAPGLRCTVCTHPERAAIDRALVGGGSERSTAARWKLAPSSVHRHKAEHIRSAMERAERAQNVAIAQVGASTLDRAENLWTDLHTRLEAIATGEDPKSAAAVARAALASLDLIADIRGEKAPKVISVLVDGKGSPRPEWAAVQRLIGEALAELPEGPRALASAAIRRRFAAERAKVGAMALEVDGGPALLGDGGT